MVSLPRKGEKGQNFKSWAVDSINKLIDYLSDGTYLRKGDGISVERTPSGIIIGLEKKGESISQSFANDGGTLQDISATVTGGTASLALSGSTSSVNFVGTGSVTISGNTNTGNIEINATGGTSTASLGFPDYSSGIAVSGGTTYGGYVNNGWLIGSICNTSGLGDTGNCECDVILNGTGFSAFTITLYKITDLTNYNNNIPLISKPVFLPIPAGVSFELRPSILAETADLSRLKYFTCITQ